MALFAAAGRHVSGSGSPGNSNVDTPSSGGHGSGAEPAAEPAPPKSRLPWPDEGQASVLVEGLGNRGDLGTKGDQTPVPIASITKVMTAYVVLQDHPLRGDEPGPDINPEEGLSAVIDSSRNLVDGVRRWLSTEEPGDVEA